jgi:hypothetical protein
MLNMIEMTQFMHEDPMQPFLKTDQCYNERGHIFGVWKISEQLV